MLCYFKFWDKHKIVNNKRMASIKVSKVNNRRMSSIKMLLKMRLDRQVPDKLFISVFACNRLILFVIISGAIFHKRMASLTQVFWDNRDFPISIGFSFVSALVLTRESFLSWCSTFSG